MPNYADCDALLEVLKLSKDATAIYEGADITILYANQAMLGFWDKSTEVIGMPFGMAMPELQGQPFELLLKEVWISGKTYQARDMPADLLVCWSGFD